MDENGQVLNCGSTVFNAKLSFAKNLECIQFLVDCGICIDGVDLKEKKQKLSDIKSIRIMYPENPTMLTGMAAAEKEKWVTVMAVAVDYLYRWMSLFWIYAMILKLGWI